MSVVLFKSAAAITQPPPARSATSCRVAGKRAMSRRQISIGCGHGPGKCTTTMVGSIDMPGTRICALTIANV